MKIIFLDIDGVLNGCDILMRHIIKIWQKLKLPASIFRKYFDIFGVDEKRVKMLAKIVQKTNAKIVMSSTWRFSFWKTSYEEKCERQKKLYNLLKKYDIEVVDITPTSSTGRRETEIQQWLNNTELVVDSFVILDDESFDLKSFEKRLVKTSRKRMVMGKEIILTGLEKSHVQRAVEILNTPYGKDINNV